MAKLIFQLTGQKKKKKRVNPWPSILKFMIYVIHLGITKVVIPLFQSIIAYNQHHTELK